ncbi:unnamed protein product [Rotaria sp. Silwood2]|nr:unnamed protein product [Rotaria sp. Silwood2]CAF3160197.1 unnamed protein product [Rotaria sp. Silwood2]CAF3358974.1 unnamed protein product [Rotaria sp. Silwood2]CAF3435225.1 unnamed protein product [Rotaria sp. Silwood2]
MSDDERKSWPQYVGQDASEVEQKIKEEGILFDYQSLNINIVYSLGYEPEILPQGSPTTRDYRLDRVRLFVDDNNKIVQTPTNG